MTTMFPMQNSDQQDPQHSCFLNWMNLQELDLKELLQALTLHAHSDEHSTPELTQLVHKNVTHFQDYTNQRNILAQVNISAYFSPTWCTSFESSMLWAGGCRPSIYIRLINALSGSEVGSNLDEDLPGAKTRGLNGLSTTQINSITRLQLKTVHKEDELSTKLASLQEEIADQPIAIIAKELYKQGDQQSRQAAEEALNHHAMCMGSVLEEADNLRLNTLKELIAIMTPVQAVGFLAASKQLHLCLHAWGRKKDQENGKN